MLRNGLRCLYEASKAITQEVRFPDPKKMEEAMKSMGPWHRSLAVTSPMEMALGNDPNAKVKQAKTGEHEPSNHQRLSPYA